MNITEVQKAFPYFAMIFSELKKDDSQIAEAYKEHVHWGYWEDPSKATFSGAEYHEAAQRLTDKILAQADIKSGESVLDVGCGFGGTTRTINHNNSNVKITGLNLDPDQIARAIAMTTPENGNEIDFVVADACKMPFEDQTFDKVLAIECMHHFPSRAEFFKEAARVLKPGGKLVITDYIYRTATAPIFNVVNLVLKVPFQEMWGNSNIPSDLYHTYMAQKAGFVRVFEQDITKNTSPSTRFVREHGKRAQRPTVSNILGTIGYEVITKGRMVNYKIIAFDLTKAARV